MKEASPERCAKQAEMHRKMAESALDPELKRTLLRIAEAYEALVSDINRAKHRHPAKPQKQ
jgi:hypothetical protein